MPPEMTVKAQSETSNSPSQTRPTNIPTQSELERMGRQRPDIFKTWWAEIGFCFSILGSMLLAVIQSYPIDKNAAHDYRNTLLVDLPSSSRH